MQLYPKNLAWVFVEAKKVLDSNVALEVETAIRKAKENEQQRTITKREED